jgi:hypothetical protein
LRGKVAGERQSRWVAIQTVAGLLRRVVDGNAFFVPALDVVDPERGESIVSGRKGSNTLRILYSSSLAASRMARTSSRLSASAAVKARWPWRCSAD